MKKSSMLVKGLLSLLFLVTISFTSSAMKNGTVKFFNETKGFGLMTDSETGMDMEFTIKPGAEFKIGDEVDYIIITKGNGDVMVIVEGKKGLNAVNVKKA